MKELTTYLPSGLIGARAVRVATFVGLPAAAALGWGLAWAQSLAHGAVASSICAVLAALVAGVVFALVADHARSRSVRANTLGALALLACLLLVRWWRAETDHPARGARLYLRGPLGVRPAAGCRDRGPPCHIQHVAVTAPRRRQPGSQLGRPAASCCRGRPTGVPWLRAAAPQPTSAPNPKTNADASN